MAPRKAFTQKGKKCSTKHWSSNEDRQLDQNMQQYQEKYPEIEIFKVFYDRKIKQNKKILRITHFWDLISYNLHRAQTDIDHHFTHRFQDKNKLKKGSYSQAEYSNLKKLVEKYGKNWNLISNMMNRNSSSLSKVYHQQLKKKCKVYHQQSKKKFNKGPWLNVEKKMCLSIVKKLMAHNKEHQVPILDINWKIVSKFVDTRSMHSCKSFSNNYLLLLKNIVAYTCSLILETVMIYLCSTPIHSKTVIDWFEVALLFDGSISANELEKEFMKFVPVSNDIKNFYESMIICDSEKLFKGINFENVIITMAHPRTIAWCKAKYYFLVSENVENFKEKSSEEIVDILHGVYFSKA